MRILEAALYSHPLTLHQCKYTLRLSYQSFCLPPVSTSAFLCHLKKSSLHPCAVIKTIYGQNKGPSQNGCGFQDSSVTGSISFKLILSLPIIFYVFPKKPLCKLPAHQVLSAVVIDGRDIDQLRGSTLHFQKMDRQVLPTRP